MRVLLGNLRYKPHPDLVASMGDYEELLPVECMREAMRDAHPQIVFLFNSLRDRGQVNPLIVYATAVEDQFEVVVGNQRLACARALGWEALECEVVAERAEINPTMLRTYPELMTWNEEQGRYILREDTVGIQ